jgi:hypothetical protein
MSEHRIRAENDARQIIVDRIYPAMPPVLFTSLSYDDALAMGFDEFARMLGRNLIFDPPELRDLFEL